MNAKPPAPPRYRNTGHQAVLTLLRVADRLRRDLGAAVEPHGVTLQQFNVLRILRGAGPEGLPTLEIGERMIEQAPGVTRLLDRLEAKGWVARARCPVDRRRVLCQITADGRALLAELDLPVARVDDQSVAPLSAGQLTRLVHLLTTLEGATSAPSSAPTASGRRAAATPERRKQ